MRWLIYTEALNLRKSFLLVASHEIYLHLNFSKYFEQNIGKGFLKKPALNKTWI